MSAGKHTPEPWSVDTVRNEGEYGNNGPDTRSGFNSFAILDAEGRVLFDSLNRDGSVCEVTEDYDEDGGSAWDTKAKADAEHIVQCVNAHDELVEALASARKLLERCGPHLQGVEQECCGNYQSDYGGEYMGQREIVAVCCGEAIDLSDHIANELRTIDAALSKARSTS